MHESLHIILNLVLPEGIQSYFELKDHKLDKVNIDLYLQYISAIRLCTKQDKKNKT